MNVAGHIQVGMASPSQVQAYAGRTLDLLQAIEKTIDYLEENRELMRVLAHGAVKAREQVERVSEPVMLDPEGRVCELFGKCLEAIERMHQNSSRKRQSAADDKRLRADDGVVEAFDAFLAALSDAHDQLHELKERIETHDALLDAPSGGTYTDVDDLFRAMGVAVE